MEIKVLDSYEEISSYAATLITGLLEKKNDLLLAAATGSTPGKTYDLLAEEYHHRPGLFDHMRVLKLDEWGGIDIDDPGTSESYLQSRLLSPLQIDARRYISFPSDPTDPEVECEQMQEKLAVIGPIDCCVLGLGLNGHVGFNEPAPFLQPGFHKAQLAEGTLQHSMVAAMKRRPSYGLTLGMGDILNARTVLLLVSGASKKAITRELVSKKITTHLPASFLWLHDNTICLLDKDAV